MNNKEISILNMKDFNFYPKLLHAFMHIGFVAIKNDFISHDVLKNAYDDMEAFFNLSQDQKNKNKIHPYGQEGYTKFGTEKAKDQSVPDLKEFYQVSSNNEYRNDFHSKLRSLFREMDMMAETIMSGISSFLGKSPDIIGNYDERKTILRAIHYPPTGYNPSGQRSAPHEDINLITLLPAASAKGLQILDNNGDWISAPTDPNLIIVNVGDMLQELSNKQFKSTTHRVINTKEGEYNSRYSLPFFFHPKEELILSERYTAGSYLDERLAEIGLK